MAQTHAAPKSANRSEAAKKAAATKAAKNAAKNEAQPKMEAPKEEHNISEEQRKGERRQQTQTALAQFQPQAHTTPAVHEQPSETAEAIKAKAFQEAVQALANSMGVDPSAVLAPQSAAKPAKAARADRQQQNGITRPASGTVTGRIWDLADKLSAERGDGNAVEVAKLRAHADMKQVNDHTLKTQFARWRSYHGIKGRTPAPKEMPAVFTEQLNRRADDPKPEAA